MVNVLLLADGVPDRVNHGVSGHHQPQEYGDELHQGIQVGILLSRLENLLVQEPVHQRGRHPAHYRKHYYAPKRVQPALFLHEEMREMLLQLEDEAEEDERVDEEEDREHYAHEQVARLSPIQVLCLICHRSQLGCSEEERG